jgi:uncharacterized membrane protein YfcA
VLGGETWTTLVAIALIAMTAGFVHSAIGFGFGIVALAFIPLVIDIVPAHVVISLSSVPMLVMAAWAYREGIQWPSLKVAMLGAFLFLPLGLLAFEVARRDWLVRGTGVAILAMVLFSYRRPAASGEATASGVSCFVAGAVSGFLAGAVSIAGPPIAAFALKQDWSQERYKAFVTQCLLLIAVYKSSLLGFRGFVTVDNVLLTLIASPLAIGGVQLGVIASRRIPAQRFRRLVAIALILASGLMIWRGAPVEEERAQVSVRAQEEVAVSAAAEGEN